MKINELTSLDEGAVADNIKAAGSWLGKKLGSAASTVGNKLLSTGILGSTRAAIGSARLQNKAAYSVGKEDFISKLKIALDAKKNLLSESEYNFNEFDFQSFDLLLENRILNETQTIEDYMKNYIGAMVSNYKINPSQKTELETTHIPKFADAWRKKKAVPRAEAEALWAWIWEVGSMQTRDKKTGELNLGTDSTGLQSDDLTQPPKGIVTNFRTKKFSYNYDPTTGWTQLDSKTRSPITTIDSSHPQFGQLNKLYNTTI